MRHIRLAIIATAHNTGQAPLPNVDGEIAAITSINGVQATVLAEHSLAEVARHDWSRGYDAILVSGHGSEQGVLLGDGFLDIASLGQYARASAAPLIFLNTCYSDTLAIQLHTDAHCAVICTITSTPDLLAYSTARLFFTYLAGGSSISEAFERSRPGLDRIYRIYGNNKGMGMETNDVAGLLRRVDDLEMAITGGRLGANGGLRGDIVALRQATQRQDEKLAEIMRKLDSLDSKGGGGGIVISSAVALFLLSMVIITLLLFAGASWRLGMG